MSIRFMYYTVIAKVLNLTLNTKTPFLSVFQMI